MAGINQEYMSDSDQETDDEELDAGAGEEHESEADDYLTDDSYDPDHMTYEVRAPPHP